MISHRGLWLTTFSLALLFLFGRTVFSARGILLVSHGRSDYVICLSRSASPSEKYAAEELRKFLNEISGVQLPIVSDEVTRKNPSIRIGQSAAS
jgi:hypothetical protein